MDGASVRSRITLIWMAVSGRVLGGFAEGEGEVGGGGEGEGVQEGECKGDGASRGNGMGVEKGDARNRAS